MTLKKAIEIFTLVLKENPVGPSCDLERAIQLGLEALKEKLEREKGRPK